MHHAPSMLTLTDTKPISCTFITLWKKALAPWLEVRPLVALVLAKIGFHAVSPGVEQDFTEGKRRQGSWTHTRRCIYGLVKVFSPVPQGQQRLFYIHPQMLIGNAMGLQGRHAAPQQINPYCAVTCRYTCLGKSTNQTQPRQWWWRWWSVNLT